MKQITLEEVLLGLDKAVLTRGEGWVYPTSTASSCHYRWDKEDLELGRCEVAQVGQPACIAGQVLSDWGLLEELVPPSGREGYFDKNSDGITSLLADHAGENARMVIAEAQAEQDMGHPWARARESARSLAESLTEAHR